MTSLLTGTAGARSRHLVLRLRASRYLLMLLVGFAGSVLGTRLFLALTGYPQIGGGTLHIAHALWGGLLLFVAALLPLLIGNRVALGWAALTAGVGVGLFIDEVGKFITAKNDYFFPAAAPIIYGVFLVAVWLYLHVRGTRSTDRRAQLYAALELLPDALDRGLREPDRATLERELRAACAQSPGDGLQPMADALLALARPGVLPVRRDRPGPLRRAAATAAMFADRVLTAGRLRAGLVVALTVLGLSALSDLTVLVAIAVDLRDGALSRALATANRFTQVEIDDRRGVLLLLARAVLDAGVGALLLTAAVLLWRSPAGRRATGLAEAGLLTALSVVNLLVFYLEQFAASLSALAQLVVLLAVERYEKLQRTTSDQVRNVR